MKITDTTECLMQFLTGNAIEIPMAASDEYQDAIAQFLSDNPTFEKFHEYEMNHQEEGNLVLYVPDPDEYDPVSEGRFPWEKPGMSIKDFF